MLFKTSLFIVNLVILVVQSASAVAQDADVNVARWLGDAPDPPPAAVDKAAYTLFNPVPNDQMRQFEPDRPGKTHSSTTVDAGHIQIESDFLNYTFDQNSAQHRTTQTTSLLTPIVKAGVNSWMDVEAAFAMYNWSHVTDRTDETTVTGRGFGDISLGSKINIFGNEGGAQALALLPFIKIPTAAEPIGNGVAEYSLNAPYQINLDSLWSLTLEPGLSLLENADNSNLHGDYSFAVNLNRPIFSKSLVAAMEFSAEYASAHDIGPRYTLDPSLQWFVTKNTELDGGFYYGLNRAAVDIYPYVGFAFRY